MRFRSDPPGSAARSPPLVTPFTDARRRRPRQPARAGALAAGSRVARHLDRRLHRRAVAHSRSASAPRRSAPSRPRSTTGCRSCPAPARRSSTRPSSSPPLPGTRAPTPSSSSRRTTRAPRRRRSTSGTRRWPASSPTCRSSPTTCRPARRSTSRPRRSRGCHRDHDNFVGVKETTKDFEHFSRVLHAAGPDLLVWSGIELLCLPVLSPGRRRLRLGAGQHRARGGRSEMYERGRRAATTRAPASCTTACTRWSTCCSSRPTRRRPSG